jgi:hypothetical protein
MHLQLLDLLQLRFAAQQGRHHDQGPKLLRYSIGQFQSR